MAYNCVRLQTSLEHFGEAPAGHVMKALLATGVDDVRSFGPPDLRWRVGVIGPTGKNVLRRQPTDPETVRRAVELAAEHGSVELDGEGGEAGPYLFGLHPPPTITNEEGSADWSGPRSGSLNGSLPIALPIDAERRDTLLRFLLAMLGPLEPWIIGGGVRFSDGPSSHYYLSGSDYDEALRESASHLDGYRWVTVIPPPALDRLGGRARLDDAVSGLPEPVVVELDGGTLLASPFVDPVNRVEDDWRAWRSVLEPALIPKTGGGGTPRDLFEAFPTDNSYWHSYPKPGDLITEDWYPDGPIPPGPVDPPPDTTPTTPARPSRRPQLLSLQADVTVDFAVAAPWAGTLEATLHTLQREAIDDQLLGDPADLAEQAVAAHTEPDGRLPMFDDAVNAARAGQTLNRVQLLMLAGTAGMEQGTGTILDIEEIDPYPRDDRISGLGLAQPLHHTYPPAHLDHTDDVDAILDDARQRALRLDGQLRPHGDPRRAFWYALVGSADDPVGAVFVSTSPF